MNSTNSPARRLKLGCFEADLRTGERTREGRLLRLQEQPFQLLIMLLGRPGELVTREEVRQRLRPRAVVDFDQGVNKAISKIPDALARCAIVLAALLGAAGHGLAQDRAPRAAARLEEVVINATRNAADEHVTREVQKVLTEDPWVYSEHITITTQNGVVRLEGFVGDTGERFRILRLCRKIPGARRVVDELEIVNNDPDGG